MTEQDKQVTSEMAEQDKVTSEMAEQDKQVTSEMAEQDKQVISWVTCSMHKFQALHKLAKFSGSD